jgi:hypothetical protein
MPLFDFALVEIQFAPLVHSPDNALFRFEFSAYVEAPVNALSGVGAGDWLPIQGVAYSESPPYEYVVSPMIAFPNQDADAPLEILSGGNRFFSLLVDLTSFAPTSVVKIGLYGQIGAYNLVGGSGIDAGQAGTLLSSEFWGSLTQDFRGFNATGWTPGGLSGAPNRLFFKTGFSAGHADLVATFPELSGVPYEELGAGTGDISVGGDFDPAGVFSPTTWINHDVTSGWGDTLGSRPSSINPNDNPNPWGWRDFSLTYDGTLASVTTTMEWGAGIPKKQTIDCSIMYYTTVIGGITLVNSVPLSIAAGSFCSVNTLYRVEYFMPTWHYTNFRAGLVQALVIDGDNPWRSTAQHNSGVGGDLTINRSWEDPDIYPDRLELGDIGPTSIATQDSVGAYTPLNHFAHIRLGHITLNRGTGEAIFVPAADEVAPVDGGATGDGPDGDGTAPGRTANPKLRTWTFTLDGHDFYVLRLGDSLTLVYDDYSEQWMDWTDFNSLTWRAHCGFNWIGAHGLADTYGSSVVVGDDAYGFLWFLDPDQPYDEALDGGAPSYFSRVTVGQVPMVGREVLPCYATWLTTDMGNPAYVGSAVTLYTSDDAGETWDNHGSVRVTPGEASPELSWYSLGQISAPGRLFKIFDNGAIARIDALEMNDPDDEK